jgi:hypothetical protein
VSSFIPSTPLNLATARFSSWTFVFRVRTRLSQFVGFVNTLGSLKQRGDKEAGHDAEKDYLDQGADHIADKSAEGCLQSALGFSFG